MKNRIRAVLALGLLAAGAARADMLPPPSGVVNLSATASVEVTKDLMTVTLGTTREGPDPQAVQTQLKQALDTVLAEARRVAKPGQLDVHTGHFSLTPRYKPRGPISSWQGSAELVVEGRDMPAIGSLVGRITSLTVSRVTYNLARETREKAEADASGQAIGRWRAHAADYAKQFGYSGYTVREVTVAANEPPGGVVPMMARAADSAQSEMPLPVEAGKALVTVTVGGSVQMTR